MAWTERSEGKATKTSRGSESEAKEIESLGIDLLFEYATTIEHLKSISDDDFETLKDTIIGSVAKLSKKSILV